MIRTRLFDPTKTCLNFLRRTKFCRLPAKRAISSEILSLLNEIPPEFAMAWGLLFFH